MTQDVDVIADKTSTAIVIYDLLHCQTSFDGLCARYAGGMGGDAGGTAPDPPVKGLAAPCIPASPSIEQ
jgi:hypothetical protein